jgi:hypothetical protein
MNQEHILSNESKMAVRSKMADQIRFFDVTLRVSNVFSIFFLHSLGLSKTQILWKKSFSKNQRWRLKRIFSFQLESESESAGIGEPMVPTFGGLVNIDPSAILFDPKELNLLAK